MASFPYDDNEVSYNNIRQPLKAISCRCLLASKYSFGGWLKKRNKKKKWNRVYVVLHNGCVYYFSDKLSDYAVESRSLFGFRRAPAAAEIPLNEALWSFKLVYLHANSFCSQYLCADSEQKLSAWIKAFENEIKKANGNEENLCSTPSTVLGRPLPPIPLRQAKRELSTSVSLNILPRPLSRPPPLLPRKGRNYAYVNSQDLLVHRTDSTNEYSEISEDTLSLSMSDNKDNVNPQDLLVREDDSTYENCSYVKSQDLLVRKDYSTNKNCDEYEDAYSPSMCSNKEDYGHNKVCFHALAHFDYHANDTDELSFSSGQIITVTDWKSSSWWFGELKSSIGFFPSRYVKRINYKDEEDDEDFTCDYNNISSGNYDDGYEQSVNVDQTRQRTANEESQFTHYDLRYNSVWMIEDRQRLSLKQLLPESLKRLDRNSVDIYLKHLRIGKERPNKIRIVIMGQKSAGKSCLARRLLKETIDNVKSTNGVEKHSFKCRARIADGEWIFSGCTYEEDLDRRLLKSCIDQCNKYNNEEESGHLFHHVSNEARCSQAPALVENYVHAEPATEYYDLYDVLAATIDENETAPVEILDFAGDTEHYNTHHTFLRQDAIYLVVTNVMEQITELDNDYSQYGLAFWLETIRSHCDTQCTEMGKFREPPVLVIGTHKDMFVGSESECKMQLDNQVKEIVRNSEIRRNIAGLYVVSNTKDSNSVYESLHKDIVDIAKKRRQWNKEIPVRWIHLEKKLQQLETPIVSKKMIYDLAAGIVQPIQDKDEIEQFLNYHNGVGTYVYFADLPENVVLNPQWLANAFKCIITADHFQGDIVNDGEWQKFRKFGRLSKQLIEIIFSKQDKHIQEYKEHILGIMEKLYIIGRPKSEMKESDYYVPCMIKTKTECNIDEVFSNCSKSSCLCAVFDFLPQPFMSKLLVACIGFYTVARVPENDKWHPAFCKDFAMFDLDETASAKMLIARHGNTIFVQIFTFGEHEKQSFKDVREKIVNLLEKLKHDRIHMNISFSLMFKCKYTENLSEVGMVGFDRIKSQGKYFCEEHRNSHKSDEIYFDWYGENEHKNFSGEQINATRMSIIILEILTDALYDLLVHDIGTVKPRTECDITYLYASHRNSGKHVPSRGWASTSQWDGIQSNFQLLGDDIERIRLVRNEVAHSKKFAMDDNKYYKMCNTVLKILERMEKHNGKENQYTKRMQEVRLKETNMTEYGAYRQRIATELPRLKMKQSFKVKPGEGCTLECEVVVPLPRGSIVKWTKTNNEVEKMLEVNETSKNKYGGAEADYPSLNIFNTCKDDEGYYSCQIEYPPESAESNHLDVVWPKTFLHVKD